MQSSLYVALSAQITLQKRLDTIANNVANTSNVGFRAEETRFASVLSRAGREPVAFSAPGETYISRAAGELVKTDNPLDVAVKGNAWFAMQTPSGTVYTRDGRMRMAESGELQTLNGYPVLDAGGAPLLIDPTAGPPEIARDGMIIQGGRQVGAIGLFTIPENAKLTRFDNAGVVPDLTASPALNFNEVGVEQGFVEQANVNPVREITRLVMVSRAFEALTSSLNETESSLRDAIRTLGSAG